MPREPIGDYVPQSTTEVFVTDASKFNTEVQSVLQANAASQGLTAQEYILSRGGVNPVTGKYGDSYNPQLDLTDAEYKAAVAGKTGVAQGEALNAAQQAKQQAFYASSGTGYQAPNGTYYASAADARQAGALGGAGGANNNLANNAIDKNTRDAYALIEDTFNSYGLSDLAPIIKGYMLAGLGAEQAKLQIKQDPIYKARFRGNQVRLDSGLNALTEAEYLGLEDTYSQVMKQYGLGDYFGTTRAARQTKLADVIGGDISAVELKSRISTVVDRVNNADPAIKAQLKEFYPGITETDLVKYFLDPKQTLPQLEEKVTSAEIGAAATAQGLNTNMTSASDLARYGIDRAAAIKGYSTIGGLLPEAQKLSGIYGEAGIDYTQATAEQEVFKGNASAERKRKQLAALETAQFGGSAGVGTAGLSTTYLRKSSSGGQF
jgi:hypothetical protein